MSVYGALIYGTSDWVRDPRQAVLPVFCQTSGLFTI